MSGWWPPQSVIAGVIEYPAKIHMAAARGIRGLGRWPEPHVVVEAIGHRLRVLPSLRAAKIGCAAGQAAEHGMEFADGAVADNLAGLTEADVGALLAPTLEYAFVVVHRVGHSATFGNRQRQRLLAVDILAGARRLNDRNGMPMVWQRNEHSVDIVAIQDFAKIFIGGAAFVSAGPFLTRVMPIANDAGRLPPRHTAIPITRRLLVNVADRHHLHALVAQKELHVPDALVARADDGHRNAVVGRGPARCALLGEERSGDGC